MDQAIYSAVAATLTPSLDEPLRRLSNAANNSRLWLAIAAGLAAAGGPAGRRAAVRGTVAIGATSALVNLAVKSVWSRQRPDRAGARVPGQRNVRMPASASFPSGHAASGFAFASAAGRDQPWLGVGLRFLAAAVAYSRVHTGVHYPGDAVVGSLIGAGTGQAMADLMDRLPPIPGPAGRLVTGLIDGRRASLHLRGEHRRDPGPCDRRRGRGKRSALPEGDLWVAVTGDLAGNAIVSGSTAPRPPGPGPPESSAQTAPDPTGTIVGTVSTLVADHERGLRESWRNRGRGPLHEGFPHVVEPGYEAIQARQGEDAENSAVSRHDQPQLAAFFKDPLVHPDQDPKPC